MSSRTSLPGQLHCRSPQVAIVGAALLRTRLRQTNALTSLARVRVSRIAVVVLAVRMSAVLPGPDAQSA